MINDRLKDVGVIVEMMTEKFLLCMSYDEFYILLKFLLSHVKNFFEKGWT